MTLLATGCTRTEWIDAPRPDANFVDIGGIKHPVEWMKYRLETIGYPITAADGTVTHHSEQGVAVTVKTAVATIKAVVPLRLAGRVIDLKGRDMAPDPEGLYYTFHLSQREGIYCRIQSWFSDDDDPRDDFGGRFAVSRVADTDELLFEWQLTSLTDGKVVSGGYVGGIFDRIL